MCRLFSIAVVIFWLAAMSALFTRDVLPAWTAQDPPPMRPEQFDHLRNYRQQLGIFTADGRRLGSAWCSISAGQKDITIYGTVVVTVSALLPETRIETVTDFDAEGGLDGFSLDVYGLPQTVIRAEGERRGIYFPIKLQIGPIHRQASLDVSASRLIGDSLQPFSVLPKLTVGQSWRMQLLNPLSAVAGKKAQFTSVIAQVTGQETIEQEGRRVDCFVVQTSPQPVKAWVDGTGRVLRQEAQVPGIGKIILRAEPYEDNARQEAKRRVPVAQDGAAQKAGV